VTNGEFVTAEKSRKARKHWLGTVARLKWPEPGGRKDGEMRRWQDTETTPLVCRLPSPICQRRREPKLHHFWHFHFAGPLQTKDLRSVLYHSTKCEIHLPNPLDTEHWILITGFRPPPATSTPPPATFIWGTGHSLVIGHWSLATPQKLTSTRVPNSQSRRPSSPLPSPPLRRVEGMRGRNRAPASRSFSSFSFGFNFSSRPCSGLSCNAFR